MDEKNNILLSSIKNSFASVVWTHKIQEKQSDIYKKRYTTIKLVDIVVTSLTFCGLLSSTFMDSKIIHFISLSCSFVTLVIMLYLKNYSLYEASEKHKEAANNFFVLRNDFCLLITDLKCGMFYDDANKRFKELVDKYNELCKDAPNTTDKAVKNAKKALNAKKEFTFTDEEIDRFLAKELRNTADDNL